MTSSSNEPQASGAPVAPAPGTPAIVLGHGEFAAGLVSAVAAITGRGDLLIPVSNRDATVDEIERRVSEAADRYGARVVFTDLPAGSCAFAARRLVRARPDMIVVTGTSLAALVDYVFHAELPPDAAAAHAADMARSALTVVAAPPGVSVTVELYRIDDRLIHGQVVVGWGRPLDIGFIVLVDDEVAASDWEQELYRMGVPPEMEVQFMSVADAARAHARYRTDPRAGIVLTGDIATMRRLVDAIAAADPPGSLRQVNLGGIHHRAGRTQRMRYVFLTADEESALRGLAGQGVTVTAQDVPAARPVPLDDVLAGRGDG